MLKRVSFSLLLFLVPFSTLKATEASCSFDIPQRTGTAEEHIKYLVISGGGARGVVLLGAFEVFLEHPEFYGPVSELFGTSVGAIASAMIASGISPAQLEELERVNFADVIGPQIIQNKGNRLTRFLSEKIRSNIAERLASDPIPLETLSLLPEEDQYLYCELVAHLDPLLPSHQAPITFRMLELLHRLAPLHFKKLSVTATCINSSAEASQCILNAETTPDLDIAVACRASASIPIFFTTVSINKNLFLEGALPPDLGDKDPIFIDGGWLQNIPIRSLEARAKDAESLAKIRRETLIFVYEGPLKKHKYSMFDPRRPIPSPSLFSKFMMDLFVPHFGQFKHLPSATKTAYEDLVHLKTHYPYAQILSFPTPLNTVDFENAARYYKEYTELGREIATDYLNHTRFPPDL